MLRISDLTILALLLCAGSACSSGTPQRVSLAEISNSEHQLIGEKIVVDGCIVWSRHGVVLLPCVGDGERRGLGLLDPKNQLGAAFGAVGALPFGGKIRAEVHGVVVVSEAPPMDQTGDGLVPFLSIEKILKPKPVGR